MNQIIYNSSMLVGTLAVSAGAGVQWGAGVGLMAVGALVIVLTGFGAWITRKAD